jgi:polyisoprenoid-binding protein YceI
MLMSVTTTQVPTGSWNVDPIHSTAEFSVKHLISTFRAGFEDVSGRLVAGEGGLSIEGSVPVESIGIKQPDLRGHVLAADFFDVENHPTVEFRSTDVRIEGEELSVDGELTIRGATRPVTARGRIVGPIDGLAPGSKHLAVELETVLDRNDYGLTWQMEAPGGRKALGDEVVLSVHLELVQEA